MVRSPRNSAAASRDTETAPRRLLSSILQVPALARTTDYRLLAVSIGTILIVGLSVAAALNGGALASGGTAPQTAGAEIDSCTTIDESGTYALTSSIENATADTCIEIRASNVVLNGNGHAIDGVQGDDDIEAFVNATFENGTTPVAAQWANHGVAVRGDAGASNVTVRNLQITDWIYGVAYVETSGGTDEAGRTVETGGTVENVSATQSATGVAVYDSLGGGEEPTAVSIADVTAVNNGFGVMFDNSTGDTLIDSNTSANLVDGVEVFNATNLTVDSTTSNENGFDGFYLQNASESTFSNNSLTNNSEAGAFLVESSGNEFSNTTARNNSDWTYYAANGSENTVTELSMANAHLSFDSRDVALQSVETPPATPENLADIGQFVNVTNTSNDSYVYLNFNYADADVGQVDEHTLRTWEYDDGWSRVAGISGVDAEANVVFANVTDFSVFAPLGTIRQPTPTETHSPTPAPTHSPTATPTATPRTTTATDDGSVEIEYLDCQSVRVTGTAADVVVNTGFYDESGVGDQLLPLGPVNGSQVFRPDAHEGLNGFQIVTVEVYDEEYPRGEQIASKTNPNREQCDQQIRPDETPTPTTEPPTPTPDGTDGTVEYLDCNSVRVEGEVESAYVFAWDIATVDVEGDGTPDGFSENPFDESLGQVSGTTTKEYDERVQILSVFLYDRPVNDPSGGMLPDEFVREHGEPDVRVDNPQSTDCIQEYKGSIVTDGAPTPTVTPTSSASPTPAPTPTPAPESAQTPTPTPDASAQAADATPSTAAETSSTTDADSE